ncbi:hypothetical protein AB1Y20_017584 [Prymnesium parvum]|uniref:Uncharacterized protein n=1 Tax=Prymnesium parvum TaxID=97485 RepID=A0AB34JPV7_PRYPA
MGPAKTRGAARSFPGQNIALHGDTVTVRTQDDHPLARPPAPPPYLAHASLRPRMDPRFVAGTLVGGVAVVLIQTDPLIARILYMLSFPFRFTFAIFMALEWEALLAFSLLALLTMRAQAARHVHSVAIRQRMHAALRSPWLGLLVASAMIVGALLVIVVPAVESHSAEDPPPPCASPADPVGWRRWLVGKLRLKARREGECEQRPALLEETAAEEPGAATRMTGVLLRHLALALHRLWPAMIGLAVQAPPPLPYTPCSMLPLMLHPSVVGTLLVNLVALLWPASKLGRRPASSRATASERASNAELDLKPVVAAIPVGVPPSSQSSKPERRMTSRVLECLPETVKSRRWAPSLPAMTRLKSALMGSNAFRAISPKFSSSPDLRQLDVTASPRLKRGALAPSIPRRASFDVDCLSSPSDKDSPSPRRARPHSLPPPMRRHSHSSVLAREQSASAEQQPAGSSHPRLRSLLLSAWLAVHSLFLLGLLLELVWIRAARAAAAAGDALPTSPRHEHPHALQPMLQPPQALFGYLLAHNLARTVELLLRQVRAATTLTDEGSRHGDTRLDAHGSAHASPNDSSPDGTPACHRASSQPLDVSSSAFFSMEWHALASPSASAAKRWGGHARRIWADGLQAAAALSRWLAVTPPSYIYWYAAALEAGETTREEGCAPEEQQTLLLLPAALVTATHLLSTLVQSPLLREERRLFARRWVSCADLLRELLWLVLSAQQLRLTIQSISRRRTPRALSVAALCFLNSRSDVVIHPDCLELWKNNSWVRGLARVCFSAAWHDVAHEPSKPPRAAAPPPPPPPPRPPIRATPPPAAAPSPAASLPLRSAFASAPLLPACSVQLSGGTAPPRRPRAAEAAEAPPRRAEKQPGDGKPDAPPPRAAAAATASSAAAPPAKEAKAKEAKAPTPPPPADGKPKGHRRGASWPIGELLRRVQQRKPADDAAEAEDAKAAGLSAPLLRALRDVEEALPPDLRELLHPLSRSLTSLLRSEGFVAHIPPALGLVGSMLSHLATHVLLEPAGRRHLRKGLQALRRTAPLALPQWIHSLAKEENWRGRQPFQFGLSGSLVLSPSLHAEPAVPLGRIYARDGEPPRLERAVREGAVVRVLMEDTPSRPSASAGLFAAVVERVVDGGEAADVRYLEQVALVFGREPETAEYNVYDHLPEIKAKWRLWLRGLVVDLQMPAAIRQVDGSETITVGWREPAAEERERGVYGTITFKVALTPRVSARIKQVRLWSDNRFLHLGTIKEAELECEQGSIDAMVLLSLESDGAYITIEDLKLRMRNIDVRAAKGGHGSRIALLLQTWNLQKWMFAGWLERSILRSIEQITVKEQVHKRIIIWDEVPLIVEWRRQIEMWRRCELDRRESERHSSAILLQAWLRGRAVRNAAPVMTSSAKSLGDAVAELFRPSVPMVELPPSKSLEDGVDEMFPPKASEIPVGLQVPPAEPKDPLRMLSAAFGHFGIGTKQKAREK